MLCNIPCESKKTLGFEHCVKRATMHCVFRRYFIYRHDCPRVKLAVGIGVEDSIKKIVDTYCVCFVVVGFFCCCGFFLGGSNSRHCF